MTTRVQQEQFSLLKTSTLSVGSVVTRIGASFLTVKAVAWFTGPEGLAKLGQFASTLELVAVIASGGIAGGVTKYVAEYRANGTDLRPLVSTSLAIAFLYSGATAAVLAIFCKPLAAHVFGDGAYWYLVLLLSPVSVFLAATALIQALLNGHKQIEILIGANIATSTIGVALIVTFTATMGLPGAFLAAVVAPPLAFGANALFARKTVWWSMFATRPTLDCYQWRGLSRFSVMTFTSAACGPLVLIAVRDYVAGHASWQEVGYWLGVSRISDVLLLVASTSLSTYFLPRFSELERTADVRREIHAGYRLLLPLAALIGAAVYFSRDLIVRLLFTPDFAPMRDYFFFQFLGDFFKIGAWVLSFLMVARAGVRMFVVTEIVFAAFFVVLSVFFVGKFGAIGATYAFALNYFMYWVCLAIVFRRYLAGRDSST